MEQDFNKEYYDAKKEMEKFRKTVDPLVALLLIDDYPQGDLEPVVRKLPVDVIERIDIRFHMIYQLLQNQKRWLPDSRDFSSQQVRDERKYCDFNEVMKILDRSKGTVDSYIAKGKIKPVGYEPGKKRRFNRADIIKFAEGLS